MQTLVLGTPATQRPLEEFLQNLGEEVEVLDADGNVRFHLVPTASAYDREYQKNKYRQFESVIAPNLEELKRRSLQREHGLTTPELLQHLNSLPLPKNES